MQPANKFRASWPISYFPPVMLFVLSVGPAAAMPQGAPRELELTRPVRPWEFLSAVGMRAGLLGNESGRMEAWVYPLKILRDFHLRFDGGGRVLPAESLARTVIARPESSTIVYSGDTFTVRETFFVPVREPGAIIFVEVETEEPLEVEAAFQRDFQLEWPAAIGGTYLNWDPALHAFYFGEEQRKFAALAGSPTGEAPRAEYETNYSASHESAFRLGATRKGRETKLIVIAGSMEGRAEVEKTYRRLAGDASALLEESAKYYRDYLARTVNVELPDADLQKAYDWSRVSMVQGMVTNPFLGTGLVAGYRTSGESQRPGFAWYFGRDSEWTSLALDAAGDFASTRTALDFLSKFQREDGKIPHEISQGASFVPWFKDFPYGFASADATPLYMIAMGDYARASGDAAFAKEKWQSIWKAYEFLKSTYDERGLPKNLGVGHGWVEGGPLLPVKTELYQSGAGAEALPAFENLARLAGHEEESKTLAQEFEKQRALVNKSFWLAEKKRYAFALDRDGKPVDEPSVLATVPMWFGVLDEEKAVQMIEQLADFDHQTDWGMRIISNRSAKFGGGGYHYGSVWPLFTGWASVGEYRYHRAFPAYANLRANALLALDGSLGHVTEVLSGDYYQPLSTSSPHQIWSAAMVVSPLLRGMFGLEVDAAKKTLTFAPHVPADWTSFHVGNVRVGDAVLKLSYRKTLTEITLEVTRTGGECTIDFRPALSPRASVLGTELSGQRVEYRAAAHQADQHVETRFAVPEGASTLRIHVKNDFGVSHASTLPPLGATSRGLRVISETWSAERDRMELEVAGAAGKGYEMAVWNPGQIESVEGAQLVKKDSEAAKIQIQFPATTSDPYPHRKVVFHFGGKRNAGTGEKR